MAKYFFFSIAFTLIVMLGYVMYHKDFGNGVSYALDRLSQVCYIAIQCMMGMFVGAGMFLLLALK